MVVHGFNLSIWMVEEFKASLDYISEFQANQSYKVRPPLKTIHFSCP